MITPVWELDKLRDPRLIPYDKLQFLERGISHLKHPSYQHIHNPWVKMHALLQERNDLAESLDNELTQTIRRKMHESLPAFRDIDYNKTSSTSGSNVYYSTLITRFITEYVLALMAQGSPLGFENSLEKRKRKQHPDQSESFYPWVISPRAWVNTPLVESVTEIELERLQEILLTVIKEVEIIKKISKNQYNRQRRASTIY